MERQGKEKKEEESVPFKTYLTIKSSSEKAKTPIPKVNETQP